MRLDLPEELRRVAGPLPELEPATFDLLSRRSQSKRGVWALALMAVSVVAAVWFASNPTSSRVELVERGTSDASPRAIAEAPIVEPATPPPETDDGTGQRTEPASSFDLDDWDVLALGESSDSTVHGEVTTSSAELELAWQGLAVEGPAPELPLDRGALVIPLHGTCDERTDVESVAAVPDADGSQLFGAVRFDGNCARAVGSGSYLPPPRNVYVISIPIEIAQSLAGVVTVGADILDFEWQVAATVQTQDSLLLSGLIAVDQMGAEGLWGLFEAPGRPPVLPPDQGAVFVAVPGNCRTAEQVRDMMVVAGDVEDSAVEARAAVYFDSSCAETLLPYDPADTEHQPRFLYVVVIPLDVARSLGGAAAYVACGVERVDSAECPIPSRNAVRADVVP